MVINIIKNCPLIRSLNLRFLISLVGADIEAISQILPNLEELDIGYNVKLEIADAAILMNFRNLKLLGVREIKIKNEHLGAFIEQNPQCRISFESN